MCVVQALTTVQLAAMVGAADPNNPIVVTVAAYVVKNSVDGHRAAQEFLLDWEEVDMVYLVSRYVVHMTRYRIYFTIYKNRIGSRVDRSGRGRVLGILYNTIHDNI